MLASYQHKKYCLKFHHLLFIQNEHLKKDVLYKVTSWSPIVEEKEIAKNVLS